MVFPSTLSGYLCRLQVLTKHHSRFLLRISFVCAFFFVCFIVDNLLYDSDLSLRLLCSKLCGPKDSHAARRQSTRAWTGLAFFSWWQSQKTYDATTLTLWIYGRLESSIQKYHLQLILEKKPFVFAPVFISLKERGHLKRAQPSWLWPFQCETFAFVVELGRPKANPSSKLHSYIELRSFPLVDCCLF